MAATAVVDRAPTGERLPTWWVAGGFAALVALTWLPYAIAGTGFLVDDWVFLRNAHFDGILETGGFRQVGRPGAQVAYALTFGVVGEHPLLAYAVLGVLRFAAAWAIFRLLDDHVDRRAAVLAVGLWLVIPTHLALEQWASTVQALVALGLVAVGGRAVLRGRSWAPLVLGAAVLSYELVLPLAAALAVVVPARRRDVRGAALGAAAGGLAFAWIQAHPVYGGSTGSVDLASVLPAHFGLGLPVRSSGAALLGLGLAVVATVTWWVNRSDRAAVRVIEWGALTFVLGLAPLLRFATQFRGFEDRLTAVSGVGVAMVLAGTLLLLPRRAAMAAAVAVVAVAIPVRLDAADRYAEAADRALAERDAAVAELGCRSSADLAEPLFVRDGIAGLADGWNASAAMQLAVGDDEVTVRSPYRDRLIGPDPVEDGDRRTCP